MTKKFLLQIQAPEDTRWFVDDLELKKWLQNKAQLVVNSVTEGPVPVVTVIREEQP
jgi:hypothetical protein